MKRMTRSLTVCIAAVMFPAMAAGETLESVQKSIIDKGKKINSMSWTSHYKQNMDMGGTKISGEGSTAYEFTKSGDKKLFRMETSYTSVTDSNGNKQTTKGDTLTICDGNFTYTYSNAAGMKSAIKQAVQDQNAGMSEAFFDTLSKSYNLELQADSKVGSRTAYVIKAMMKQPMPGMASEQIMYFDKATGVMLKSVHKDAAGKVTMETTTTDLKIGSTISADRFVFKAPEGVQVIDMTQQAGQAQQAQPQEPAAVADDSAKSDKDSDKQEEATASDKDKKKKKKKSKWFKLPKRKRP